jgi:predicted nucleic acid-binding protein
MSGKYFLDTNVFVYLFDATAPAKARKAARLVREAVDTGKGVVSYQVVQEFFNVAFRRFARPMTVAEAEQYMITVFRPLLSIHSSPALYVEALRIAGKHRLAWYDSIIVASALESHCDTLYSDFQQGRKIEGLHIQNPFA